MTMASSPPQALAAATPSAQTSAQAAVVEQPSLPLSKGELEERVTLSSPALLKELFTIAQQQIAAETGRQTRLDSKATSLLTAAGLSLTVAFTYGGQIVIAHRDTADKAHIVVPGWALFAYSVAVLFGLAAASFAVWALLVRRQYP